MTEYEYEYYSVSQNDWIQIRILFGFLKMTEYEYEYYSISQKWPNTNTNIIWLPRNDRIRIQISICFPIMTEYKYHLASQKWLNTIHNTNFVELPKRKSSKTSSECHKVMLISPSPLKLTTNANSFKSIWLTRCDSGIWGWTTVVAHQVVLAALSTQRRSLSEDFMRSVGWFDGHTCLCISGPIFSCRLTDGIEGRRRGPRRPKVWCYLLLECIRGNEGCFSP